VGSKLYVSFMHDAQLLSMYNLLFL